MNLQYARARVTAVLAVAMTVLATSLPASAQKVPDPVAQEVLIKGVLMSFNDANITDNYTVFHARLAKPFRDEFSPERLAAVFKPFRDQKANFAIISTLQPVASQPPSVEKGVLRLYGHFPTTPSRVNYFLEFMGSEGEWKAIRVEVQVKPVE